MIIKTCFISSCQNGQELIQKGNFKSSDIKATLSTLNDRWCDLNNRSLDKGIKLRQATQQQMLNRALEDVAICISEMEIALSSEDLGQDLHSVKGLNKKQQVRHNTLSLIASKNLTLFCYIVCHNQYYFCFLYYSC